METFSQNPLGKSVHRSLRSSSIFTNTSSASLFSLLVFQRTQNLPQWKTISKQRGRTYLYLLFKEALPKAFRPEPWVRRFTHFYGGSGTERPNLKFLTFEGLPPEFKNCVLRTPFICIMPSSNWRYKNWPVEKYIDLLQKLPYFPILLGGPKDREGVILSEKLTELGVSHLSGVGKWNLRTVASVLHQSIAYLGSDTGLAHLSEAVGTPAFILFGPTSPDVGAQPWQKKSKAIGKTLWCRPCGTYGKSCYRPLQKQLCLTSLPVSQVLETVISNLKGSS